MSDNKKRKKSVYDIGGSLKKYIKASYEVKTSAKAIEMLANVMKELGAWLAREASRLCEADKHKTVSDSHVTRASELIFPPKIWALCKKHLAKKAAPVISRARFEKILRKNISHATPSAGADAITAFALILECVAISLIDAALAEKGDKATVLLENHVALAVRSNVDYCHLFKHFSFAGMPTDAKFKVREKEGEDDHRKRSEIRAGAAHGKTTKVKGYLIRHATVVTAIRRHLRALSKEKLRISASALAAIHAVAESYLVGCIEGCREMMRLQKVKGITKDHLVAVRRIKDPSFCPAEELAEAQPERNGRYVLGESAAKRLAARGGVSRIRESGLIELRNMFEHCLQRLVTAAFVAKRPKKMTIQYEDVVSGARSMGVKVMTGKLAVEKLKTKVPKKPAKKAE